ncbi:MAG: LysR family transcriptional regulator [Nostocoides sp.]
MSSPGEPPDPPASTSSPRGHVTWSRLVTFAEVADRGSVRAAAQVLHVTESAVSAAISAIERQLGVALLRREGRRVVLTDAGSTYADYARTLLGLADEAASAAVAQTSPRLRVGAVSAAAEYVLPAGLGAFRRRHPGVEVSVTVLPRDPLFAALTHHECDVVIAGRPPRGLALVPRARRANRLVVIASPSAAATWTNATWLLRAEGSGIRTATVKLLADLELTPELLELGSHGAVVASARAGLGVTLAHEDAVADDLASGELVVLDVPGTPLVRPWIVSTNASPTPSALAFVDLLCTEQAMEGPAFTPIPPPRSPARGR